MVSRDNYLLTYHCCLSIIEGTRESLDRLQLDYVDVIFAHRPDHTGMFIATHCAANHHDTLLFSVPMEEVVRAFNWVVQKGWVCYVRCKPLVDLTEVMPQGLVLGHF